MEKKTLVSNLDLDRDQLSRSKITNKHEIEKKNTSKWKAEDRKEDKLAELKLEIGQVLDRDQSRETRNGAELDLDDRKKKTQEEQSTGRRKVLLTPV